jgi:hypothetical protein
MDFSFGALPSILTEISFRIKNLQHHIKPAVTLNKILNSPPIFSIKTFLFQFKAEATAPPDLSKSSLF